MENAICNIGNEPFYIRAEKIFGRKSTGCYKPGIFQLCSNMRGFFILGVARPLHLYLLFCNVREKVAPILWQENREKKPEDNICSSGQFKDGVIRLLLLHISPVVSRWDANLIRLALGLISHNPDESNGFFMFKG